MMLSFGGKMPRDEGAVFVAANATVLGDVTLGRGVNIWYGAVLRADEGALILGENSNVQDNAVLHCDPGGQVVLGKNVTVGHGAILHGCTVEDVIVEHSVYGQLAGQLNLSSRYDVAQFIRKVAQSDAKPLSALTEGIHLHTLRCPDEAAFERVRAQLDSAGFLVRE